MENNKEKRIEKAVSRRMTFPNYPPLFIPRLPLPQRFIKAKLDEKFSKFLNMLKKLEMNIPFVEALAQMQNYINFIKEIMSNKKKLDAYGIVNLLENCSAIIHMKLPKKFKDLGSFTISCVVEEHT